MSEGSKYGVPQRGDFQRELEGLLNRHSKENGSNTPDFILSVYLMSCLEAFDHAVNHRNHWYGEMKKHESSSASGA